MIAVAPTMTRQRRVNPTQFGARLRQLREAANFTQKALAKAMGVSVVTVSAWELGNNSPNFVQVVKMANILGYAVADFAVVPANIEKRGRGRPAAESEEGE